MNNKQVAHHWAAQRGDSAKGSNLYYNGAIIYSYGPHFPIAMFRSSRHVLITTQSYSVTTSRHVAYTRQALIGLHVCTISVPDVTANTKAAHARNVANMVGRYNECLISAGRARLNTEWHVTEAAKIAEELAVYCSLFDATMPTLEPISAESIANAAKRKAQAIKAERDRHAQRIATERQDWRDGKRNSVNVHDNGATMLRLSRDGNRVETSRGADVSVSTARRLFRAIDSVRGATDETRAMMIETFPSVDGFALRAISADGTAIVGCHTLEWSETSAFAAAQGWVN